MFFERCGDKNTLINEPQNSVIRLRDVFNSHSIQLLHATFKASWWSDSEGGETSFVKICEAFEPITGVTADDIRKKISRIYNQKSWYQVVEDIDIAVRNYKHSLKLVSAGRKILLFLLAANTASRSSSLISE